MPRTPKTPAPKVDLTPANHADPIQPQLVLSQAEIDAILEARKQVPSEGGEISTEAQQSLANALITAIEATRPPAKKTVFTRKKGDPWQPKDGSEKLKLRRKMYQHGIELNANQLHNEQIELLNKLKPGIYCGGHVRVIKRRDRSLDVDYPIKTASQRLKLINAFGIRSFTDLLKRLVDEAAQPKMYADPEDDE